MLQDLEKITFEQLTQAVAMLIKEVRELKVLVEKEHKPDPDRWFNIQELCQYVPDHPSRQTVYGWVNRHNVPYHKKGKKLQFLKSEIDEWLKSDKRKTASELHAEAIAYVNRKAGYEKYNKFMK